MAIEFCSRKGKFYSLKADKNPLPVSGRLRRILANLRAPIDLTNVCEPREDTNSKIRTETKSRLVSHLKSRPRA
ncbi:unnamed protein product [Dovyalis caffra]|uniref:Uncharacterized protein n=1 Tax=Dovyalis caffra TaxID=77055 RepID=A0AAV1R6W7_9ROSI|nr:unnamed protein product [Dovyalis caffra]